MSWKEIVASLAVRRQRFMWGLWRLCAGGAALAAVVSFGGFVGWQGLVWLQTSDWPAMPLASYGLTWIGQQLGHEGLTSWGSYPQTWIGAHRILDWLSVGVTLAVLFMVVRIPFAALEGAARQRVRELEDQARYLERERTRYLSPE